MLGPAQEKSICRVLYGGFLFMFFTDVWPVLEGTGANEENVQGLELFKKHNIFTYGDERKKKLFFTVICSLSI